MNNSDQPRIPGIHPDPEALDERISYGMPDPRVMSAGPDDLGRIVVTERDIDARVTFGAEPETGEDITANVAHLTLLGWTRVGAGADAGTERVEVGQVSLIGSWHAFLLDVEALTCTRIHGHELASLVAAGMETALTGAIEDALHTEPSVTDDDHAM